MMKTTVIATKSQRFTGDKKILVHFLAPYEKVFIERMLPFVPKMVSTAHLTLMTLVWSLGIVCAGFLAIKQPAWLWLFSGCVLGQYITDMLDGAIGRERHSGLIKWGFYMDHFLDFIFLSAIIIGYSFLLPASFALWIMACFVVSAGFMVHTLMDFSITHNFKISVSFFGVSEARLVVIVFNTVLISAGVAILTHIFPAFVCLLSAALCFLVYKSQKTYAHLDAILQSKESVVVNSY